jgi:ABC-type bacteriocin/lantibiotic exporter with double-glycine peptidase domain
MVLEYLGVTVDEQRLRRRLGTTAEGTLFPNITRLEALGLFLHYGKQGEVTLFERYLEWGLPVIVGVKTLEWQHWGGEVTRHAVVVVGIDRANNLIYINDPFFADAPIAMPLLRFEIGWEELDRQYAVIALAPPEDESTPEREDR